MNTWGTQIELTEENIKVGRDREMGDGSKLGGMRVEYDQSTLYKKFIINKIL